MVRPSFRIDVDFSLPAERVIRSLEQIMEWRGKPRVLRCDNGPEYISIALKTWAENHNIQLDYIEPGKPQQNAYVERYNRTVRYDWLAQYLFESIAESFWDCSGPGSRSWGWGGCPGDIIIERDGFRLHFPLMTSHIVSVALSLLFWWFRR